MAFSRPTLSELITRTQEDFQSRLELLGKIVANTFVWIFARVYAGLAHGLYGFISWASKQFLPDTADEENLTRYGSLFGITRNAAAFAEGQATFSGTNGTIVPADTILERADGAEFRVVNAGTVASYSVVLDVRAEVAGEDGNAEVGVTLSFQTPIDGVDLSGLVSTEISSGVDLEDLEDYRARVLSRMSNPVQGGSETDYAEWAKEVAGVTRAWVVPQAFGAGTVATFFVRDDDDPIFPSVGEVSTVSAYIEARRPVTAQQYVFAPTSDPVAFSLSVVPDIDSVKQAVTGELEDLFLREGEPGGTVLLSHMNEAISLAQGEIDHVLTTPASNYIAASGYLPQLGAVTFT